MPLVKRALSYQTGEKIRNFLCCPITSICGCLCLILSCCQRSSGSSSSNGEGFSSLTEYFWFADDRLDKRCAIIADEARQSFADYQNRVNVLDSGIIQGLNLKLHFQAQLWQIFNISYYQDLDILNTSSKEIDIQRLKLVGKYLAEIIVGKLPKNLETAAVSAKKSVGTPEERTTFCETLFKDLVITAFLEAELPACYEKAIPIERWSNAAPVEISAPLPINFFPHARLSPSHRANDDSISSQSHGDPTLPAFKY
jgi:hypothetical protein